MSVRQFGKPGLVAQALAASTLLSVGLYVYAAVVKGGSGYFYLVWNLFLGALPLLFAWLLLLLLRRRAWSSWSGIGLSILWLGFLPNSFYMVTDYIHLQEVGQADLLFYVVMFTSFIVTALIFGYTSLFLVQSELRKRLPAINTIRTVAIILLVCSFAIYLGRDLRWNTWDVIFNPGGLLFDVSDRFLSPSSYRGMLGTTGLFMLLLSTMYFVIWRFMQVLPATATPVRSAILKHDERDYQASTSPGHKRRR